jgi:hypothetical protein
MSGIVSMLSINLAIVGAPFFRLSEIGPPKSNLSKSLNGPVFAGENGRKSRALDAKSLIVLNTLPAAPAIPAAIISIKPLPAALKDEPKLLTTFSAASIPVFTADLILLIPEVAPVLIASQADEKAVFMPSRTDFTVDFTASMPVFIAFLIPLTFPVTKVFIASHIVEKTVFMPLRIVEIMDFMPLKIVFKEFFIPFAIEVTVFFMALNTVENSVFVEFQKVVKTCFPADANAEKPFMYYPTNHK